MLAEHVVVSGWPFKHFLKTHPFTQSDQLRKGWEFDRVYSQGKRLHGKGFTLIYCNNNCGCNRIGISVNRKIRGAIKRNRIKRIIRESFRLQRDIYPPEADLVFTVRPDFDLASPQAVTQAVVALQHKQ